MNLIHVVAPAASTACLGWKTKPQQRAPVGTMEVDRTDDRTSPVRHAIRPDPPTMPQVPNPKSTSTSTSCSPSPLPQHHAPAPALDLLLDDNWFFSNTLANNKPPSTSTGSGHDGRRMSKKGLGLGSGVRRLLLRTPSLPTPRRVLVEEEEEDGALAAAAANNQQQLVVDADEDLVDDDDLNWSSIYEGVLRTRMAAEGGRGRSALQRAPSMPVVPSDHDDGRHGQQTKFTPSMPRLRHSYSTLLERHTPTTAAAAKQHQQKKKQPGPGPKKLQQQDKRWKSWRSDPESMEVQGFRDLGFVFDKEELRESLADVLPGLKHPQAQTPRPSPSEAWQQRPALVRRVQSSSSAAEMKDQLRMWAQAVACNVRQEC